MILRFITPHQFACGFAFTAPSSAATAAAARIIHPHARTGESPTSRAAETFLAIWR